MGTIPAQATGKMVERDSKADSDTVQVGKNARGADAVKEIRFGGKKTVLIFE